MIVVEIFISCQRLIEQMGWKIKKDIEELNIINQ